MEKEFDLDWPVIRSPPCQPNPVWRLNSWGTIRFFAAGVFFLLDINHSLSILANICRMIHWLGMKIMTSRFSVFLFLCICGVVYFMFVLNLRWMISPGRSTCRLSPNSQDNIRVRLVLLTTTTIFLLNIYKNKTRFLRCLLFNT